MESCRRIVAGRWQCSCGGPGEEGMRYIQRALISPPFLRRGGAKRRGGFGACHHPAACGGTPPRRGGGKPKLIMPRRTAIGGEDTAIRANYADALRQHGCEASGHAAPGEARRTLKTRLPD